MSTSTPVEMIEALQSEWRKTSQIPNCNSFEEGYAKAHEWLARELDPILAAAREQERELATLHEQIMRYQADPQYDARFIEGQEKTEAMLREQHSADLQEVAELASLAGKTYGQQSERYMNGEVGEQPDWPTPDSIVREFHLKRGM